MTMGFVAFLLLVVLPPPLPVLLLVLVAGWFLLREVVDGLAELFGADAGRAQRRHAERMTRMQHQHDRWRADREARLGDPHPTIGRAVQGRIARWIEQSGTRIREVEDRDAADRDAGRETGGWVAALRRAKQATSAAFRGWAQHAEKRLDGRPRVVVPAPESQPQDGDIDITADDQPVDPTTGPRPVADPDREAVPVPVPTAPDPAPGSPPLAGIAGVAPTPPAAPPESAGDPRRDAAQALRRGDTGRDEKPVPVPPDSRHVTITTADDALWRPPGVITMSRRDECPMPVGRPIDVNEDEGRVEYRACGKPLAPGSSYCGGEHVGEPPRSRYAEDQPVTERNSAPSPDRKPHLVLVQGTPTEGDALLMTDTLNLASGQTINPEAGATFADSVSNVLGEVIQRTHNSVAALEAAKVAPAQIAELKELANLVAAAQNKAQAMAASFRSHQEARGAVESAGAGTDNNYLGRH